MATAPFMSGFDLRAIIQKLTMAGILMMLPSLLPPHPIMERNINTKVAVPFVGVGATADALNEFDSSDPKFAGGLGFRYLIARKMRLTSGVDIAYSQEGLAIYFVVGSGL